MRRLFYIISGIFTIFSAVKGRRSRGYGRGYSRGGVKGHLARRLIRKILH